MPDLATWRAETVNWRPQWETVVNQINATYTGPDMFMIPAGTAMVALYDQIEGGSVYGLTSLMQIFKDQIHMNDIGNYFVALVHYATIYKRSPVGLTNETFDRNDDPFQDGDPFEAPHPDTARDMQKIVWEVVRNDPYSGCSNCQP